MTFEMSDTSIFSLPPTILDPEKEIDVKKFTNISVKEFVRGLQYNEQTLPAGLDSENALFELFAENPKGDYKDPRKSNYEEAKPFKDAFTRLKKNKDFKLFYEVCITGYMMSLYRPRKRAESADLEMMISKEIQDKVKVVFGIMNQFHEIANLQEPKATEKVAD